MQPGRATAECRMAGKQHLARDGENAHTIVGFRIGGGQQKRRLCKVGPSGESLHLRLSQVFSVDDNGQTIPFCWV